MRVTTERVVAVLVVASIFSSVPIETSAASVPDGAAQTAVQDVPTADTTVTRIEVADDGSARWSVTVRTRLENDTDVADYEAFQDRFRADREAYADRFERRMTGVVSSASDATSRNMTATEFRVRTSIQELPRRWGVVTYSFTWTNFAAVDGETVVVGDVFEGGFYLDDGDRLQLVPPAEYVATSTSPPSDEVDDTTVIWIGPDNFATQQPAARFEPAEANDGSDRSRLDSVGSVIVDDGLATVIVVAAVVLVAGGVSLARRRDDIDLIPSRRSSAAAAVESADRPTDTDGETADDADAEQSSESIGQMPSPDLATDDDRVRALLEHNGGRMRQAAIADELEWSASKTSRVVSRMADEGAVEKLRIGRENVIDLLEDDD
ncbi:helix-turn-helix transcriptional regulator [Natribaculum luteum]|uniref:Helix-turn-helix transcriptional regulator n=1 Tax=Natribaculum luteum TaxID=1586232 RepID=A0ABD5P092_9EURY|nr:DUF4897 domain-containing protein [Natribaculum luteum]